MRDTSEFFEQKSKECEALAERAENGIDREFWLRLARRWEELLQPRQSNHAEVVANPIRKYGLGRTRFTRRRAASIKRAEKEEARRIG
jgi:hypothetical protein